MKLVLNDGTEIELHKHALADIDIWLGGNPLKGLSFYVEQLDIEQVTGQILQQPEMYPPIETPPR